MILRLLSALFIVFVPIHLSAQTELHVGLRGGWLHLPATANRWGSENTPIDSKDALALGVVASFRPLPRWQIEAEAYASSFDWGFHLAPSADLVSAKQTRRPWLPPIVSYMREATLRHFTIGLYRVVPLSVVPSTLYAGVGLGAASTTVDYAVLWGYGPPKGCSDASRLLGCRPDDPTSGGVLVEDSLNDHSLATFRLMAGADVHVRPELTLTARIAWSSGLGDFSDENAYSGDGGSVLYGLETPMSWLSVQAGASFRIPG